MSYWDEWGHCPKCNEQLLERMQKSKEEMKVAKVKDKIKMREELSELFDQYSTKTLGIKYENFLARDVVYMGFHCECNTCCFADSDELKVKIGTSVEN